VAAPMQATQYPMTLAYDIDATEDDRATPPQVVVHDADETVELDNTNGHVATMESQNDVVCSTHSFIVFNVMIQLLSPEKKSDQEPEQLTKIPRVVRDRDLFLEKQDNKLAELAKINANFEEVFCYNILS
jgi:uncharacterized protein YsxB (DUF464 family)